MKNTMPTKEEVIELFALGSTIENIAEYYNVSEWLVTKIIEESEKEE